MPSDRVIHVTDAQFEAEVLQSDVPVLVDFWATWCAPCKAISPLVDSIADSYGERVRVAKVDIDRNPKVAATFGVRSIPTLLVFKGGKVVDKKVGAGGGLAALQKLVDGAL